MLSSERNIDAEDRNLIPLNLIKAGDWFYRALATNVAAVGGGLATRAESAVLMWISVGEHRGNRLAAKLGISRQAVHTLINGLVERKVLRARPDPTHKRAMIVEFSSEEIPHHHRIATLIRRVEGVLGDRLGKKKVDCLREVLAADWGELPNLSSDAKSRAAAGSARPRRRVFSRRRGAARTR